MSSPLRVLVLWFPDWPMRAVLGSAPPHPPTALVQAISATRRRIVPVS